MLFPDTVDCYLNVARDLQRGEEGVKFDMYSNNMWAVRHTALGRFQQAARKVGCHITYNILFYTDMFSCT